MEKKKSVNEVMEALNHMKDALSQIEKKYTMEDINEEGLKQDGNTGEAEAGEQDYSTLAYDAKKKMLIKKLKGE
jgi:hypothetical protein